MIGFGQVTMIPDPNISTTTIIAEQLLIKIKKII